MPRIKWCAAQPPPPQEAQVTSTALSVSQQDRCKTTSSLRTMGSGQTDARLLQELIIILLYVYLN